MFILSQTREQENYDIHGKNELRIAVLNKL